MIQQYFNDNFHPELIRLPIKGSALEAVADMLNAKASHYEHLLAVSDAIIEEYQKEESHKQIILYRKVADICRHNQAKTHGITIEEVPFLLKQFSEHDSIDLEEYFQKSVAGNIDIAGENLPEYKAACNQYNIAEIKTLMSFAAATQAGTPNAAIDLVNQLTNTLNTRQETEENLQEIESEFTGERKAEQIHQYKVQLAFFELILQQDFELLQQAIRDANPVKQTLKQIADYNREKIVSRLEYILGDEPGTHTQRIEITNLLDEAKQWAREKGIITTSSERKPS